MCIETHSINDIISQASILSASFQCYKIWFFGLAYYVLKCAFNMAFLVARTVKNLPAMQETYVQSLGRDNHLEKGMAVQSNILAWIIPQTEEPGGLQPMGSQRVRHDWVTSTFTFTFIFHLFPVPGSEYRHSIYILLVILHEVITYMFHSSKSKID